MKTLWISIIALLIAAAPVAAEFTEFGYNYNARIFNGWYGQWYAKSSGQEHWDGTTLDAMLVMKWSKDWVIQGDNPAGAWTTNHWTWYSDSYDQNSWYGWDTREEAGTYKIDEFSKIMAVSDNKPAWLKYQAGGAYDAQWGTYAPSGVPKYVVFQDLITVTEQQWDARGARQITFNYAGTPYTHDMVVGSQTHESFSGTGSYPSGSTPSITWTINGAIEGNDMSFTVAYDGSSYVVNAVGTVQPDGTMSGTWTSNAGQSGTWSTTGTATYGIPVASYNIAKAGPKGLGKPIF